MIVLVGIFGNDRTLRREVEIDSFAYGFTPIFSSALFAL